MTLQIRFSASRLILRPLTLLLVLGTTAPAAATDIIDRDEPMYGDSVLPVFGSSLAASDSFLVVGTLDSGLLSCPFPNALECYHGLTYVYDAVSHARLFRWEGDAPSPPRNDFRQFVLLTSVATNGEVAVVHERYQISDIAGESVDYAGGDVVHIYDLSTGVRLSRLAEPPPGNITLTDTLGARDHYRPSVAVDGNVAIVGMPGANDHGKNSGTALIIDLISGQVMHRLVPEDNEAGDEFGWTVALSGQRALISAPGQPQHAAYVFDVQSGQELAPIAPLPGGSLDETWRGGFRLFMHQDIAWVGRRWEGGFPILDAIDLNTRDILYSLPPADSTELGVVTDGTMILGGTQCCTSFIRDVDTGHPLNVLLPQLGSAMAMNEHSLYVQRRPDNVPYARIYVYPKPTSIPEPMTSLLLMMAALTMASCRRVA